MPKTRAQKEEQVTKIAENLSKSKSVVFTDYKGMTMSQLSTLRKSLREVGAELTVTKNNLLKLALKSSVYGLPTTEDGSPKSDDLFTGPIATLFAYDDEITPIKILAKALKDNDVGKVKAGLFEGEYMDEFEVAKLSSLLSKDELRAKLVGSLGSPLYGIVGVLQANLRNLVYALEQVRVQKGVNK